MGAILIAKNISKSFVGVQALESVNIQINAGEIHCLAGENGCGKSTLVKCISGVYKPDQGEIIINGNSFTELSTVEAMKQGIQVIYQDMSIFPNLSVAENIAMNYELFNKKKFVNWKSVREVAKESLIYRRGYFT